jgi:hypothetical protein
LSIPAGWKISIVSRKVLARVFLFEFHPRGVISPVKEIHPAA